MRINKVFKAVIKSLDEMEHTVTAVVSTDASDRYGDIVEPKAFVEKLPVYKAHPILLSMHNSGGGVFGGVSTLLSQIGEAKDIRITVTGLEVDFKYYVGEGNPEADWAFRLARKGIASYSIGFMDIESEPIKDDKQNFVGRRFKNIELLEISQVLIPANREALQNSIVMGEMAGVAVKSMDLSDAPVLPILKACTKCGKHGKGLDPMDDVPAGADEPKCKCNRKMTPDGNCVKCNQKSDQCMCEPVKEKEAGKENTAAPAIDTDTTKTHYTEHILGAGEKSHTAPSREDLLRVVAEGVKSVL